MKRTEVNMADVEQPAGTGNNSTVANPNGGLTTRQKFVYAGSAIVAIGVLVAIIVLAVHFTSDYGEAEKNKPKIGKKGENKEPVKQELEVCKTDECVDAAKFMKKLMNESVSPCEDFYEFSCGNFKTHYPIPEGKKVNYVPKLIIKKIDETVKSLLEAPDKQNQKPYVTKVKTFYKSCTDESLLDKLGNESVRKFLNEDLGGWPLVIDWEEKNFNLTELLLNGSKHTIQPLVDIQVAVDRKNVTENALYVGEGKWASNREEEVERSEWSILAWLHYVAAIADLVGIFDENSKGKDYSNIYMFYLKLSNISEGVKRMNDINYSYNKMTLKKFSKENSIPGLLDMGVLIKGIMSESGVVITDDDLVINRNTDYFKKLKDVLIETDKKTITNFIIWSIIEPHIRMFPTAYRTIDDKYGINYLRSKNNSREKECINIADKYMGSATARMYLDVAFPPQAKEQVNDMVDHIQDQFTAHLNNLAWMDEKTRLYAIEKNKAMNRHIGYPDIIMNDTFLNNLYKDVSVTREDALSNYISMKNQHYKENLKNYGKPIDKKKWIKQPHVVNAYYEHQQNQIFFPAGILQNPFFFHKTPRYLDYAGIGSVIGHEIGHAFDNNGRLHDKTGLERDWWTPETNKKFIDRTKCMIDQYDKMEYNISIPMEYNISIPGKPDHLKINVSGVQTLGENIADNCGLKISFKAYKSWEKDQGKPEPRLPDVKYTNDQVYFINYAQVWCSVFSDESLMWYIKDNEHSPMASRVRGTISNMPMFGDIFECARGTKMNPENKCTVW